MQLSIVIVSYNVRYFLEQTLRSVDRARKGLDVEVFVVDNASVDDSVKVVRERFPWVVLIANDHNPGFSVANNQAVRQAVGKYVLLLNPDTVVEENSLRVCFEFMERHPNVGGLGVRMIDGSGRFLPESKRGLPTPWVAFTKAFGLARLFPRSRTFNRYHLGYLDEYKNHRVEVLSGAFMFLRSETLQRVGLLDEDFFMYGEDIDLSYRITQGGYENWYLAATTIIHYKGESTKKGSLNYVKVFYRAMIIFARKHFTGSRAGLLVLLMQTAVYVRAIITLAGNLLRRVGLALVDALVIYGGLVLLKNYWAAYHFHNPDYYDDRILYLHFPAYIALWLVGIFLSGGYDRPFELRRLGRGLVLGTLLLTAVYGLLPGELRPSRALLLLGTVWAVATTLLLRLAWHFFRFGHLRLGDRTGGRLAVVGSPPETLRVMQLLQRAGVGVNFVGRISPPDQEDDGDGIGNTGQLTGLVRVYNLSELIFCSADLPLRSILGWMSTLGPRLRYKILPEHGTSIIGSHSGGRAGELYTLDFRLRLAEPVDRRAKWLFDKCVSVLLLITWPFFIWLVQDRSAFFSNIYRVLIGRRTWVGYYRGDERLDLLPELPRGVLQPGPAGTKPDEATRSRLNLLYARDYTTGRDLDLIVSRFRELGNVEEEVRKEVR